MPQVTKRKDPMTLKQWIDDVNAEGRGLTDWETQFMESLTEQFDRRQSMSEKQEEILERIYVDKVK